MAKILLFVFMIFLVTPSIISVIEKNTDLSVFYNLSEEEKTHKEVKAIVNIDITPTQEYVSQLKFCLIHSENLSKHDKISSKIFIPPPDQV